MGANNKGGIGASRHYHLQPCTSEGTRDKQRTAHSEGEDKGGSEGISDQLSRWVVSKKETSGGRGCTEG
jgi:hypothetical protein